MPYSNIKSSWKNSYMREPYNLSMSAPNLQSHFSDYLSKLQNQHREATYERSTLDRVFDPLNVGTYSVAGFFDGIVDGKGGRTPLEGFADGIKASNPFGKGHQKGRTTFSDVLTTAGWEPETWYGKTGKWVTGLAGDIFLDPTTYLTGGLSAGIKGTGKVGKTAKTFAKVVDDIPVKQMSSIVDDLVAKGINPDLAKRFAKTKLPGFKKAVQGATHMTDDMAEVIVKSNLAKSGIKKTADEIKDDAMRYATQFNDRLGLRKEGRITWGVGNMPFAPKKVRDKVVDLGSDKPLRDLSDSLGISRVYSGLRDSVYGTKFGSKFSSKSRLYNLAHSSPDDLWTAVEYVERTRGMRLNKMEETKEITNFLKNLNLTPDQNKEILEMMEDRTIMSMVAEKLKVKDLDFAKKTRKSIESANLEAKRELDGIDQLKKDIDRHIKGYDSKLGRDRTSLDVLQDEYRRKIIELDTSSFTKKNELERLIKTYQEAIDELDKVSEVPVRKNRLAREEARKIERKVDKLTDELIGSNPTKAREEVILKELEDLKGSIEEFELSQKNLRSDLVNRQRLAEKDARGYKKKLREMRQDPDSIVLTDEQIEAFGTVEDFLKAPDHIKTQTIKQGKDNMDILKEELGEYIYDDKNALINLSEGNVKVLMERVRSGYRGDALALFIEDTPELFNPHMSEVNKLVAKQLGYRNWHDDGFKRPLANLAGLTEKQAQRYSTDELHGMVLDMWNARYAGEADKQFETLLKKKRIREKNPNATLTPKKRNVKKLSATQEKQFEKLTQKRFQREYLRRHYAKLEPDELAHLINTMDNEEYLKLFGSFEDEAMDFRRAKWFDEDPNSVYRQGQTTSVNKIKNEDGTFDYKVSTSKDYTSKVSPQTGKPSPVKMDSGYNEYKTDVVYHLTADDQEEIAKKMVSTGVLTEKAFESAGSSIGNYVNRVTRNLNHLSDTYFMRGYHQMSPAQQDFAVKMSAEQIQKGQGIIDNKLLDDVLAEAQKRVKKSGMDIKREMDNVKRRTPSEIAEHSSTVKSDMGSKKELLEQLKETQAELRKYTRATSDARKSMMEYYEKRIDDGRELIEGLERSQARYKEYAKRYDGDAVNRLKREIAEYEDALKSDDGLETYLRSKNKSDLEIIKDRERYIRNVEEVDSIVDGKVSFHDQGIVQIKKGLTPEDILEDLKGNLYEEIPIQKHEAFRRVEAQGWTEERILEVLSEPERAKRFLIEKELGHLENTNPSAYWRMGDDLLTEDKVVAEAESVLNALEKMEGYNLDKMLADAQPPDAGIRYLEKRTSDETVREVVEYMREKFMEMGKEEVRIGKLMPEQFEANMMSYLPHVPTEDGHAFFRATRELEKGRSKLTHDYGFGQIFSHHSKARTTKGTVTEVNEYFRNKFPELLKGKNVFSENVADIYMARASKHVELMYDDRYMREMVEIFGKEIPANGIPDKGYKAVMNHGMMRKSTQDMASMQVSTLISDDVSEYVTRSIKTFEDISKKTGTPFDDVVEEYVAAYVEKHYGDDKIKVLWDEFHEGVIKRVGFDMDVLDKNALPMQELTPRQTIAMQSVWNETYTEHLTSLDRTMASARNSGSEKRIAHAQKRLEKLADRVPPQMRQVNDTVVEMANEARILQRQKDESRFLQMYDKFVHFMKLNQTVPLPGFHGRNKMSNIFNNWLEIGADSFNLDWQTATTVLEAHSGDVSKIKDVVKNKRFGWKSLSRPINITNPHPQLARYINHGQLNWIDLHDLAKRYGVIDEGLFAKDIGAGATSKGFIPGLKKTTKSGKVFNLDPTDTTNFVVYQAGTRVGTVVENSDRLIHFASALRRGMSLDDAAASVNKFLFDYGDITAFEQSVMKRIIPFYTWIRKNARLQTSQIIENPGKFRDIAKFTRSIENITPEDERMDKRYVSNWASDWLQLPFSRTNEMGQEEPILFNPNLPYMDLNRLPDPTNIDESVREWVSQTSTPIKLGIEYLMNKNLFFNSEIAKEGENKALEYGKHALSQVGAVSMLRGFNKDNATEFGLHALNSTVGLKFSSYNYNQSKYFSMNEGNQTPIEDALKRVAKNVKDGTKNIAIGVKYATLDGLGSMAGQPPKSPSDYNGALRPLSVESYNKLSDKEKEKYTPPSREVAMAYNRRAVALSKAETEKAGRGKRFIWTLLDNVDDRKSKTSTTVGYVTHVVDGDTFKAKIGDKEQTVRLLLVDTPETQGNFKDNPMLFGGEASEFAKDKLLQNDVKLHITRNKDAYGRTLAYVELDDGSDFNKQLIEEGYGRVRYTHDNFSNTNSTYDRTDDYYKAQIGASSSQKGVWSIPEYGGNPLRDEDFSMDALERYLEKLNKGR